MADRINSNKDTIHRDREISISINTYADVLLLSELLEFYETHQMPSAVKKAMNCFVFHIKSRLKLSSIWI